MSRGKRLEIELKPRDRQQVEKLLAGGVQAVRPALRAWPCAPPDRLLAEPASPTCSSIRSDVPRRASHESAARSDRSTCPGRGSEPLPPALSFPAASLLPLAPVQQSLVALFFEALPPSTHLPLADAHQLRYLPPLDLARCGSEQPFLQLHRPT